MKAKIYLLLLLNIFFIGLTFSQNKSLSTLRDTGFFNYAYWNGMAAKMQLNKEEAKQYVAVQREIYFDKLLEEENHHHPDKDSLIWVKVEDGNTSGSSSKKGYGSGAITAGPCTNIDFESGTFSGWTRWNGWNPLTNAIGCCTITNGDQTIMSGAGTDPYGGFPVVYPGGGSFSCRLGSTTTGGRADRIEQTFFVTAANANFTYRYAAVLNDGGHPVAQQPRFTSEIIDTLGNTINCTYYNVSAGSGVTGYSTSALIANGTPVIYKNWTNVVVDLTPNIGQNVTLRFTVYDCGPSGHFAYAYLDGLCTSFQTSTADTICPGASTFICAPAGFSLTTWNGPGGVVNDPNQCIAVSVPGVYTCTTLLVPGCPGPTFTHTLTQLPPAILSVNPVSSSPCSTQYTFNNTSAINSPFNILQYKWGFGDGFSTSSTTTTTPVHNYALPGTYQASFTAISDFGCQTQLVTPVTIFPPPIVAFSPPSGCLNTVTQFSNSTTVAAGTVSSYFWNFFGAAPNTTVMNPSWTYTAVGNYTISLTATSNQGCTASLTQTLSIFPAPIVSFTANSLCDRNGTSFAPATSTAISSGSLTQFFWSFGDGGTSTVSIPTHTYTTPGFYNVVFTAISDHNCSATTSNTFQISPSPTVAFSTTSLNACSPTFTFTDNSGISSGVISHTWDFGGGVTSSAASPSYTFPSIGNYTVRLIGVSSLGCGDTATQYISIYPYPSININVPASCENAIITVSTTAVSGSVTSYAWDFGDPSSGVNNTSNVQNPTHHYTSMGNYLLTLNIVSNLNCPSTTTRTVVVYPNPIAVLTHPTPTSNCSLGQVFSGTNSAVAPVGGSSVTAFQWSFQNIGTSTLATPGTINYLSPGTYSVSMIAITNFNCSDTVTTNITIHPQPVVDFTVYPNCVGGSTQPMAFSTITPIPGYPASLTSYTWDYGDGTFTNSAIPPAHVYANTGVYNMLFGTTSDMGCSSTVTKTVEIFPSPATTIAVNNLCYGNLTQFTSTNNVVSTSTIFVMNWDFGDGTGGSNAITTHTYSAPGNYVITYSASTNHECTTIQTQTITIYPLPVVSFSANGGCLNVQSQFSQTSSVAGGFINGYSWNFGDGSGPNASIQQNPPYTYSLSGTYLPTLTVVSDHTCYASAVNTVVIDPLPNISFNPSSGCEGATLQFTNTSSILLGTINSYTWNFGNSNTSNIQNPVQTYSFSPPFGTYTVTLGATSNSGCVNSAAKTLTINPLPNISVFPVLNSCVNDQALLHTNMLIPAGSIQTSTIAYGDGATSIPPSLSGTATVPHTYTAYATYTVNLTAVSNQGCSVSTFTTINVYPKPFVNFTVTNVCNGALSLFTNTSNIPAGYTIGDHLWNFNDNSATPTSTLINPSHIFIAPNTLTAYPVSLTESSYPEGPLSPVVCSQTGVKTITIFPHPSTSFFADTVCMGSATPFHNTTPTLGVIGWSWSFLNNGQTNSLSQNPSFTYTGAATSYTAQLIAVNNYGCRDTSYNTVDLYLNPIASFTTNNNCFNDPSIFFNNSTFPIGNPSSYLWTTGNTTITTNTDATYLFTNPGTYSVTLTAFSSVGCSNKYTSTVTVYPLPQLSYNTSPTCLGQSMQFNNSSAGANIVSYSWNFGDPISGSGNISSLSNPGHTYSSPGVYSTTLSAISDKNCTAMLTNSVMVHDLPHASFTNTVLCVGDDQAFINLSTTNDGSITLNQWDFNSDNIVDQTTITPVYSYSVGGNYQIRLTVVSQYGCADDTVRQVFANPKAQPVISADLRSGCPELCVNFKNLSTISSGSFTTAWDFGDGSPTNSFNNPSHCFDTGTYDVGLTMVSDIGCVTKYTHPAFVNVSPLPVAGFKVDPEQIDEDEPIINVTSTASSDANYIKYYVSDGSSFGTPSFSHYIKNLKQTKPMVVQIVKNQYGCIDTIAQVIDIKPAYVIYFPNVFTPNGDGHNDTFFAKGVGILKFSMQIYDRWGHQVFSTNDMAESWDGKAKNSDDQIKEDVYTWKAQVTDIFSKNHFLVGSVSVLR